MTEVTFGVDTLTKDGMFFKGTKAMLEDDYAESLSKLTGVTVAEKPKAPKKRKKKDDDS